MQKLLNPDSIIRKFNWLPKGAYFAARLSACGSLESVETSGHSLESLEALGHSLESSKASGHSLKNSKTSGSVLLRNYSRRKPPTERSCESRACCQWWYSH